MPAPLFVAVPNVFGYPADDAIAELQEFGFAVIAYEVCSGSVRAGEVRQVISVDDQGNEIELVGRGGTTDAGSAVAFGSTVEVKIGTGSSC